MKLKKLVKAQTPQNRLLMCKVSKREMGERGGERVLRERRLAAAYERAHGGAASQAKESRIAYVVKKEEEEDWRGEENWAEGDRMKGGEKVENEEG